MKLPRAELSAGSSDPYWKGRDNSKSRILLSGGRGRIGLVVFDFLSRDLQHIVQKLIRERRSLNGCVGAGWFRLLETHVHILRRNRTAADRRVRVLRKDPVPGAPLLQ